MPGQHPSDLASREEIERVEGTLAQLSPNVDRGEILIRELQGKLNSAQQEIAALKSAPGRMLDFQRLWCTANNYRSASFNGAVLYHVLEITATLGLPSLVLNINLPVPFLWEVTHQNGIIRKDDAAYHNVYSGLRLAPADLDGISVARGIVTQHSTVDVVMNVNTRRTFRCAANTTYQVQAIMGGGSGGTWNYFKDENAWLEGKAVAV